MTTRLRSRSYPSTRRCQQIFRPRSSKRPRMGEGSVSSLPTSPRPLSRVRLAFLPNLRTLAEDMKYSRWNHVRDRRGVFQAQGLQSEDGNGLSPDHTNLASQRQPAQWTCRKDWSWVRPPPSVSSIHTDGTGSTVLPIDSLRRLHSEMSCSRVPSRRFSVRTSPTRCCCSSLSESRIFSSLISWIPLLRCVSLFGFVYG